MPTDHAPAAAPADHHAPPPWLIIAPILAMALGPLVLAATMSTNHTLHCERDGDCVVSERSMLGTISRHEFPAAKLEKAEVVSGNYRTKHGVGTEYWVAARVAGGLTPLTEPSNDKGHQARLAGYVNGFVEGDARTLHVEEDSSLGWLMASGMLSLAIALAASSLAVDRRLTLDEAARTATVTTRSLFGRRTRVIPFDAIWGIDTVEHGGRTQVYLVPAGEPRIFIGAPLTPEGVALAEGLRSRVGLPPTA